MYILRRFSFIHWCFDFVLDVVLLRFVSVGGLIEASVISAFTMLSAEFMHREVARQVNFSYTSALTYVICLDSGIAIIPAANYILVSFYPKMLSVLLFATFLSLYVY